MNLDLLQFHPAPTRVVIPKDSTLLMYSGGLDSLGALWVLLNQGRQVHVHHVVLVTIENRWEAESAAVQSTFDWLRENGFEFTQSSSVFKMDGFRGGFLYDADTINLIAGGIAGLSRGAVKQVAIGKTKSDESEGMERSTSRGRSIYSLMTNVPKVYPVEHLSKRDIWGILPSELRSKAWSCRTPIVSTFQDSVTCKPCGTCKSCNALAHARA